METKKISEFKFLATLVFGGVIFGMFLYIILKGDFKNAYLSFSCVGLCFLFSLLFIKLTSKKILITLALATNVVADYFLILTPSEENKLIGLGIFCGVQFFYLVYSLLLNKSIGVRIVNISLRVALCLIAYYVLPKYFSLSVLELVAVMYILNFLVSLLVVLCHIKTEWLLFVGLLLFFACDIFVGLAEGGFALLNLTGNFVDFVLTKNVHFWFYIPGLFLIATSSVWASKKKLNV